MIGGPQNTPQERLLAFHPIVLGDQVIVSDGTRVLAYNLNDRPADSEGEHAAAGRARVEARPGERCPDSCRSVPCKWGFRGIRSRPWDIGSMPEWGR